MLIMLLLFPILAFADEMSSEKYCFPSGLAAKSAEKKFSAIQISSDVVTLDENCLIIQMRPHRRELVQRYILSSAPGASISFSSAEIKRETCKLKVEKVQKSKSEITNAGINSLQAGATQTESSGSSNEIMQIDTLDSFQFSVDQNEILGRCSYITPDKYNISIEVRENPKPIVPSTLPPGTIVVLNNPPPDQKTMVLKTELQLTRGEKIEIGELIRKLNNKENSVDINPSLKIERKQQNTSARVFLSFQ